jgi:hypothetical protein
MGFTTTSLCPPLSPCPSWRIAQERNGPNLRFRPGRCIFDRACKLRFETGGLILVHIGAA